MLGAAPVSSWPARRTLDAAERAVVFIGSGPNCARPLIVSLDLRYEYAMSQNDRSWYRPLAGFLLILLALILLPFVLLYQAIYSYWLQIRFWRLHGSKGRFILFVYSDSPNWKEYIESCILPQIENQAVVLNWSERREWQETSLIEAKAFHHWAGKKEFNPLAIIFSRSGRVTVIRFWRAFRDRKHGSDKLLKETESSLYEEMNRASARDV